MKIQGDRGIPCREVAPMPFSLFVVVILVMPFIYVFLVGKTAYTGGEVDERSRENYFETVKTLVTAAGIAIAVIAAGFQQKFSAPVWILQRATISLSLCVMLSVTTMLEMSRSYEEARKDPKQPVSLRKLLSVLVLGYLALVTFLLGFAYLTRLTLYM
jgi:hypothetical protein